MPEFHFRSTWIQPHIQKSCTNVCAFFATTLIKLRPVREFYHLETQTLIFHFVRSTKISVAGDFCGQTLCHLAVVIFPAYQCTRGMISACCSISTTVSSVTENIYCLKHVQELIELNHFLEFFNLSEYSVVLSHELNHFFWKLCYDYSIFSEQRKSHVLLFQTLSLTSNKRNSVV